MLKNRIKMICPRCGMYVYDGYPALSRKDNKTKICSNCGTCEALEDFYGIEYKGVKYWEDENDEIHE